MATALAPAGKILVRLSCAACATVIQVWPVEAVIDADGDLAFDTNQLSWFAQTHHAPSHQYLGQLKP